MIFVTCFYNRPKISKLYLLGLERLKKIKDFDVLVCVSDNDSEKLCIENSIDYFYYDNLPIGEKHNKLFETAYKNYDFDFLIHSGDDDVISDAGFRNLLELMQTQEYICHKNLYFYDTKTKRALESNGTQPMGAFRAFSRATLSKCLLKLVRFKKTLNLSDMAYFEGNEYLINSDLADMLFDKGYVHIIQEQFSLYPNEINKALDFHSHLYLFSKGVVPYIVDNCEIVDFKSEQNIWKFTDLYVKCKDVANISHLLGEKELSYLECF